ncbi:hypothetical protein ZIOFF_075386 [Zingiber officinale]|uniref:N-acetyltransferase domain-containing protein n=1 Tax=Zingiber officinale TaxID=94328 RepID=A0A8J5EKY1_ZINOF|nr:hypothetical protein ZIOFF_075386 [Zingiber officinale]
MSDGHKTKRIKRSRRQKGGACDDGAALLGRRSAVDAPSCFAPNPLLVLGGDGLKFDWWGSLALGEAVSDDELWAAVRLRVRTFYKFNESFGIEDYKTYVTKREFDGLQDRIVGRTPGYNAVACINATLPVSTFDGYAEELCSLCKFSRDGEEHVVVGTLDVNWCLQLPDELTGIKPEGIGVDLTRAYISNVCVAEELQRNGLGYALISKSKQVALSWGITDLYVHVVVGNEGARKLYDKSGFVYESEGRARNANIRNRPTYHLVYLNITKT